MLGGESGAAGGEVGGAAAFSAEQLAAMLAPAPSVAPRTRGLKPGTGSSQPEAARNGVVPDLRVNFGFNSATVQPAARATLDELGRALQFPELRPLRFDIGGHTDAVGDAAANERLSRRRAEAVVSYLTGNFQIEPERLRAVGFGERELLDPAKPASGTNRRVEVRTVR